MDKVHRLSDFESRLHPCWCRFVVGSPDFGYRFGRQLFGLYDPLLGSSNISSWFCPNVPAQILPETLINPFEHFVRSVA
jgi:hypothetical protein